MSQETSIWLNTKTKIGFTAKRGKAWHYREEHQVGNGNHYKGAIPIDDIMRDLFNWEAVEFGPVTATIPVLSEDGVDSYDIVDPNRKLVCRPRGALGPDDPGGILGAFMKGYTIHQHPEWLLNKVAYLLDSELAIGSAGLLKQGAVAFVQVEVPDTIETPEGVKFRPHLLAAGSMDGSLSSTYKRCVQIAVCDNTVEAALGEPGQVLKVKHSKYSDVKLQDAREALAIVHTIADEFSAQVAELCSIKVSDGDWEKFLDEIAPKPDDEKKKFAATMSLKKRVALNGLWAEDERVAPWTGTAFGVLQAMNTYAHHISPASGDRFERNQMNAIKGRTGANDANTLKVLAGLGVGRGA